MTRVCTILYDIARFLTTPDWTADVWTAHELTRHRLGRGGGSDPTPLGFSQNNFIYYRIDMKLGTPLRASIWRRLVQRKTKSAGIFLL